MPRLATVEVLRPFRGMVRELESKASARILLDAVRSDVARKIVREGLNKPCQ
jgi:hypothetical protein